MSLKNESTAIFPELATITVFSYSSNYNFTFYDKVSQLGGAASLSSSFGS